MKDIIADASLVAHCGLYCGACKRYLTDKCPGCAKNEKAAKWCGVRTCNKENNYATCADCQVGDINTCKAYNNFVAKVFAFVFRSDRRACIERIRVLGPADYAEEMTVGRKMTIRRS